MTAGDKSSIIDMVCDQMRSRDVSLTEKGEVLLTESKLHEIEKSLWHSIDTGERCLSPAVDVDVFFSQGRAFSNLWELLGGDVHSMLQGLMRASGVEESHITGLASAYDKTSALAEALPAWAGNPYYGAIHQLLKVVFDCHLPLDHEHLPHIWQHTASILSAEDVTVASVLKAYGYGKICCSAADTVSALVKDGSITPHNIMDMTMYVSPYDERFPRIPTDKQQPVPPQGALSALTAQAEADMQAAEATGVCCYAVDLSEMKEFPKPHPYTVGQVYGKLCLGEQVTSLEKDLVTAQMLRLMTQKANAYGKKMMLYGAAPEVYEKLCSYLSAHKIDAPTLCVARNACDAVALICAGAAVWLEMDLCITEWQAKETFSRIAAGAPIGRLAGLYLPVKGLVDLPLADRIERIFCGCLENFGAEGMGPSQRAVQVAVANAVLRRQK